MCWNRTRAAFLWFLTQALGARSIVEIGTSRGVSTLWLADAARSTGGHVLSVDVDAAAQDDALRSVTGAGLADHVTFRVQDGGAALAGAPDGGVDLLFLDAERTEYPSWWPHPVRVLAPGACSWRTTPCRTRRRSPRCATCSSSTRRSPPRRSAPGRGSWSRCAAGPGPGRNVGPVTPLEHGHPVADRPRAAFRRDRLTWVAYVLLAFFAYLQAAPGLVIVHLRDELGLSYSTGGLHVAAFAAGSLVAGVASARLERALGRRTLFWSAAAVMGAGAIGLTAGRVAAVTVGSVLVMGVGGGLLLVTIQAALADHHGDARAVALAEANVAASIAYVVLIGVLSLAAALHVGWRLALLASLVVPALAWWANRRLAIDAPPPSHVAQGRLSGVFWVAAAMLFCTTAAEWCITAWGATFVEDAAGVSSDTAVALMAGYFGGVLVGRTLGSRLARRHEPERLLALALAVTAAGFAVLWPSAGPAQALVACRCSGSGSATCSRWGCP